MTDDIDDILGVDQSPQKEARNARPEIPLQEGRLHKRKPMRKFIEAMKAKNAAQALQELPEAGETWHYIMNGNFDSFDLIDCILYLAKPEKIKNLYLATLGFNATNTNRLMVMLEENTVGKCQMIVSCYYESDKNEADVCYKLRTTLPKKGGWYIAARSHCKIIQAELEGGRHIVIESSANLRSCRNLEQFTISNDKELFNFHAKWMETVYATRRKPSS